MAISFGFSVPDEPGVYFEIDHSQTGVGKRSASRVLVMGPMLSGGSATEDIPIFIPSAGAAGGLFGAGSVLAGMVEHVKKAYPAAEVWALPQADPAGTAPAAICTVTATGVKAGVIPLYIGGVYVPVAVDDDDTANVIVGKIKDAVNAKAELSVTATTDNATVTFTFKHAAALGSSYDIRQGYRREQLPEGVGVGIGAMSAGAGVPDLEASLAALGDVEFDTIIHPYTDAGSLQAIKIEMASRWSPLRSVYGLVNTAVSGTYEALTSWASTGPNDQYTTVLGLAGSPTPPWIAAAALGALTAQHQMDAADATLAQGFAGLELYGVLPPLPGDSLTVVERNILLKYGLATVSHVSNTSYLSRARTSYTTDAHGSPDRSLFDQRTLAILMRLIRQDRQDFLREYSGSALTSSPAAPGVRSATVEQIRGWFLARYMRRQDAALVQNVDKFMAELIVERDEENPNQINVLYPPQLTGWLAVMAGRVAFRLV